MMKAQGNAMRQLSDDWLSENSQWFRDYEGSFESTMPDVVRSFVQDKSLDKMSSVDILRTIDWLRTNPVAHVETKANGEPHVTPFIDPVTGEHPAGYYSFDDGFLDYAMSRGWLSLPSVWYVEAHAIAGIADTFEEVQAHVGRLSDQYARSEYGFVRNKQFVVLVRETSDLDLVHEFSHVGRWGQRIRNEQWGDFPCPMGYPEKKELEKMKRVIHYQHLKSSVAQEFNKKFAEQFLDWSFSAFKEYEFDGHNPYCNTHHTHHKYKVFPHPECAIYDIRTPSEIPRNSQKDFGFPVFSMQSVHYEQACRDFADSQSADGSGGKKIFQFEVLNIESVEGQRSV